MSRQRTEFERDGIVAISSRYVARPYTIERSRSRRSPTGEWYRVSVRGEMRQRTAVSLGEALLLAKAICEGRA